MTTWQVVENFGGVPGLLAGTLAARPAPNPASDQVGRLYVVISGASLGSVYRDNGTSWDLMAIPADASDTVKGIVELATDTETQTGTDTARAITPANLTARSATETRSGIAELATQSEADTGTDDTTIVTPLKLNSSAQLKARTTFADMFSDFVVSGFNPSLPGATLTMTTPAGVAYIGGARVSIAADTSRAYTASRDIYLDVNASGTYTAVAVTNGAAEPAVTSNSLRILKVVTSGTQVTSIVQRSRASSAASRLKATGYVSIAEGALTGGSGDGVARKHSVSSVGANADGFWSVANTRYQPQIEGYYLFSFYTVVAAATANGQWAFSQLLKNGSAVITSPLAQSFQFNTFSAGFTWIVYGLTTDYFEHYAASSGPTVTSGQFSGVFLGASPTIPGP